MSPVTRERSSDTYHYPDGSKGVERVTHSERKNSKYFKDKIRVSVDLKGQENVSSNNRTRVS